ncbi:MAG: site-2 protease family protein [Anaerolineae bacterium]|jgi:regulator of sigma E protease|nr:site-2 protease family protein [Anaerolineae bacterium]MBT7073102.1 site-2 protease family protein [Anaerolineae bacterium]MBT7323913.1 site-2 protease family protein [Anaerolineae bacterium]
MSANLIAGIVFVAVFGVVILVHELGHFIVGRLFKIEIEEFGIGMPPKMLTLFTWQGTEFTLNWLPFGGFNRFKGEDNIDGGEPEPGGLSAASPWARLAVLLAGAAMNLVLGVLVYSMIFSQTGIPNLERVQVYEVTPGSPAEEAGFLANDILLKMNGELITSDIQMRALTKENLDQTVSITLLRDGEEIETSAMPLSNRTAQEGAFGFLPGFAYNETPSFSETIFHSAQMTYLHARELLLLPGRMLFGNLSPEEGRFIGFRGIFNIFQQTISADMESRVESETTITTTPTPAAEESSPTFFTLSMIANLTITLGVFNLLPFPALDGGRIFFLLPELFFRKRVPARFEGIVHWAGMMLLLGLMFYINIMDFVNPVNISFP